MFSNDIHILLQYTNIRARVSRNSKQIANWMKCVPSRQCQIFTYTLQKYVYMKYCTQWIGLREHLQETMVFTIKLVGVSCKFSHHPIPWYTLFHHVSSNTYCLVVSNKLGLFSTWYMGCHPSHWRSPSFFRGVGWNHQPDSHDIPIKNSVIFRYIPIKGP